MLSAFGFLCFASTLGRLASCLTLHVVVVVRRETCFQPESELKWFDGAVKGASRFETLNLGPLCYQREHTWTSARVRPQLCCLESCLQSFWIVFFPLLLDSISALSIGGGWRAGGSGPNAGRRSAAETVDASLLCLKVSSPTLEEEPNSASCAAKWRLASRLFCVLPSRLLV